MALTALTALSGSSVATIQISKVRPPVVADRGASTRTKNASAMLSIWHAARHPQTQRQAGRGPVTIETDPLPASGIDDVSPVFQVRFRERAPLRREVGVREIKLGRQCETSAHRASASIHFSRRFSSSSALSRLASDTSSPPNLAFHLKKVAELTPCLRQTFAV